MPDKVLQNKKILLVIAFNDYQDLEYKGVKKALKAAGAKVEVASSSQGTARGKLGGETKVDVLINEVDVTPYNAVVFIGGPGTTEYVNSEDAYRVARETIKKGKILAAICMAPLVLAKAGVLQGKKATVWTTDTDDSLAKDLAAAGAEFVDQSVVTDESIVTGNGPEAVEEFGQAIIKALT